MRIANVGRSLQALGESELGLNCPLDSGHILRVKLSHPAAQTLLAAEQNLAGPVSRSLK